MGSFDKNELSISFRSMNLQEREAIAVISLAAALADGSKSESERAEIRELFSNLELSNTQGLIQQVLMKKVTWETATDQLKSIESRQLAFEMAVCVCESDGLRNEAETSYLANLGKRLGLENSSQELVLMQAESIVLATPLTETYRPTGSTAPEPVENPSPVSAIQTKTLPPLPEGMVSKTAILAGALELLPQSMATLAVLPLQAHLVFRIGKHYGYTLDSGHMKEFLAVGGLGLASQALEGLARKFLGGMAKKAGGGLLGGLVSGTTGPAMTFASTYAIGKLADQYYSQGRQLPMSQLKNTFQSLLSEAQGIGKTVLPQIQSRAKSLSTFDLTKIAQGSLLQ